MANFCAGVERPAVHLQIGAMSTHSRNDDALSRLAALIESRKPARGGDPASSYVARLLERAPDAILKKIGEEATEVVMAGKDLSQQLLAGAAAEVGRSRVVAEVADLWFHCLVALAHFDLHPNDVVRELERREGTSGLEEKALRKAVARESARVDTGEIT